MAGYLVRSNESGLGELPRDAFDGLRPLEAVAQRGPFPWFRSAFFAVTFLTVLAVVALEPRSRPLALQLSVAGLSAFATLLIFRAWLRARPREATQVEIAALSAGCAAGFVLLFQNVLVHDALWYYSYLRSAIVDKDLDLYEEFVLRNPNRMYLPPPDTPIFHLGISLAQAPIAWLVRPAALLLGRAGVVPGGDGYGPLEVGAATWSSMMLAVGGVALTHRLARTLSSGPVSAVAQVALLYASPLAYFAFVWPGYPHAASVFLAGAFLLIWVREEGRDDPWRSLLLGLLAGALALAHPQDIVYVALPGVDLLAGLRRRKWHETLRAAACLTGGAVLGFAPQMGAWAATSGTLLPSVYTQIGDPFQWSRPAVLEVMFSGYNGLFTWTPLCAIGVGGLFFIRREHPRVFGGLLLLLLLEWWAISSYGYWWGGASFGNRYFLSAYPVLGVGLAVALHRAARRVGLLVAGLATVPFILWNLLLMTQFRLEWIQHNRRPDFPAILARQVDEAPSRLWSGLVGAFRWNQVLVVEQLRAALESRSTVRLLIFMVAVVGLVGLLVIWVRCLSQGLSLRYAKRAALLGVAAMALATSTVLAVAHDHNRRHLLSEAPTLPRDVMPGRSLTLRLMPREDGPTPEHPTAVFAVQASHSRGNASSRLDVVSFLRAGHERREGEVVAWLSPHGRGCGRLSYPIRAGYETAETAPDLETTGEKTGHDIEEAVTVQTWWQRDPGSGYYWGHAYLASWELPLTCQPEAVTIRATPGTGVLELREIALSDLSSEVR